MRGRPILTLALCGAIAGCGDSNLNPFNWFGGEEAPVVVAPDGEVVDPRPLVDQVTSVTVERAPGGAIVRATGLPPMQGYWSAALVPADRDVLPDENGVLTLDFRALPPASPQPAGTPQSREIVTGFFLSEQDLRPVRSILVRAERNSRSVRR